MALGQPLGSDPELRVVPTLVSARVEPVVADHDDVRRDDLEREARVLVSVVHDSDVDVAARADHLQSTIQRLNGRLALVALDKGVGVQGCHHRPSGSRDLSAGPKQLQVPDVEQIEGPAGVGDHDPSTDRVTSPMMWSLPESGVLMSPARSIWTSQ